MLNIDEIDPRIPLERRTSREEDASTSIVHVRGDIAAYGGDVQELHVERNGARLARDVDGDLGFVDLAKVERTSKVGQRETVE
jgi:hypothetical protein